MLRPFGESYLEPLDYGTDGSAKGLVSTYDTEIDVTWDDSIPVVLQQLVHGIGVLPVNLVPQPQSIGRTLVASFMHGLVALLIASSGQLSFGRAIDDNVDLLRLQARQQTQEAYDFYQKQDYREAVDSYLLAVEAWNQLLEKAAEDGPAKRQLAICQHNLRYCLLKPSEVAAERAKVAADEGNSEEAFERYMEAVKACEWAATKSNEPILATNQIAYVNKAGLILVRQADRYAVEEKYEEAIRWYERAAQHFRSLNEQFPQVTAFDRNLDYVELKRLQLRFKVRSHRDGETRDLQLLAMDGANVSLVDAQKLTIVVLWTHGVEASRTRLQAIDAWAQGIDANLRVVGVCLDRAPGWGQGKEEEALAWAKAETKGVSVWADAQWLDRFGIPAALPNVWIVRTDGSIDSDPALSTLSVEDLAERIVLELP